MMAAELRAAIDLLSMRDPTVHASLMAGHRQGLSEVDTLAHTVLHLANAKAELEAALLKRAMEAPPPVLVRWPEGGTPC